MSPIPSDQQLLALIDDVRRDLGSTTPYFRSGGAIGETMIWDYLACVEDGNPAYWSDEWAAQHAETRRLVVPPQMLLTHSRFPPGPIGTAAEWEPSYVREAAVVDPLQGVLRRLREHAGLDVYTNASRHERYLAPIHPGDRLVTSAVIELSPIKQTWLGRGVFLNTRARYRRESDDVEVAESENSLFVYSTSGAPAANESSRPTPRASLSVEASNTKLRKAPFESLALDDVHVGDRLPVLALNPTFMDLMRAAQGTRHPVPMHTDRSYAQAAGNRDAYFSTLWQAGILGRFVTDWSGPAGTLRALSFTMVDNICPGDAVTVAGVVTAVDGEDATIQLEMATQLGLATKATSRVTILQSE